MKALLVLLLCLPAASAFASDGNRLLIICASADKTEWTPDEFQDLMACENYIDGVIDANAIWHSLMESEGNHRHDKSRICASTDSGINTNQGARIVLKYLNDHPDKLHWPAATLVLNSIHEAFPCPAK